MDTAKIEILDEWRLLTNTGETWYHGARYNSLELAEWFREFVDKSNPETAPHQVRRVALIKED